MQVNFKILKLTVDQNIRLFTSFNQHYSNTNAFQALFWIKSIARLFYEVQKIVKPYDFLSILLSTTILNDYRYNIDIFMCSLLYRELQNLCDNIHVQVKLPIFHTLFPIIWLLYHVRAF